MAATTNRKKHNILRFPSSKRERRRLLRESQDQRVRVVTMLRTACGWLLVVAVGLFLLSNYHLFSPASLQSLLTSTVAGLRQQEGDATTIVYENGAFVDAALFEGGLAYADSDSVFLARPGGHETLRKPLGFPSPAVDACRSHILTYDRGGTSAVLTTAYSTAAELTLGSPIITGSIAENGHFVLVTDEQGYRTAVAVYDTSGREVFKFQSSEYYILSAALSSGADTLAVLAFRQDAVMLDSHVLLYNVSTGERLSDAVLTGSLGLDLRFLSGGRAAVLADDGLYLVDRSGETEQLLTIVANDLLAFSLKNGGIAIAARSYTGGARSDLYTVESNGTLSGPFPLAEEPSAVALSDTGIATLTSTGVSVYDRAGTPLWRNSEAVGARRVLLTDDGTVYALYTKNTRLFTARSEHSERIEDIPHAT